MCVLKLVLLAVIDDVVFLSSVVDLGMCEVSLAWVSTEPTKYEM